MRSYIICSYKHVFDKGYCNLRSVVMFLTILCVCDDSLVFIYTLFTPPDSSKNLISYKFIYPKDKTCSLNETITEETILWRSKLLTMEVLHDTFTTKET